MLQQDGVRGHHRHMLLTSCHSPISVSGLSAGPVAVAPPGPRLTACTAAAACVAGEALACAAQEHCTPQAEGCPGALQLYAVRVNCPVRSSLQK